MNATELYELLEPYNLSHLECDGSTRVMSWVLKGAGVEHVVMLGRLEYLEEQVVEPHFWIVLEDSGLVVDFKARMWLLNNEFAPHGVFEKSDFPNALYVGEETKIMVNKVIFNMLTRDQKETSHGNQV